MRQCAVYAKKTTTVSSFKSVSRQTLELGRRHARQLLGYKYCQQQQLDNLVGRPIMDSKAATTEARWWKDIIFTDCQLPILA